MKIFAVFVIYFSVVFFTSERCNAARCVKRMSSSTGVFASPRYPNKYPSDSQCDYVIKADTDHYIEVIFRKFKLEVPYQGEKTDYIMILDGGENNRQGELTVDGSQKPPSPFVSLTPRVIVRFSSNSKFEYSGFYATYKFIKREGCDILKVDHGSSTCDLNDKGLARYCEVTCDEKFIMQGKAKSYCQKGDYVNPPTCIADPSHFCNFTEVEKFNPSCESDEATGMPMNCDYSCAANYHPIGNGTFSCVNGAWEEAPMCIPDPDSIDMCNADSKLQDKCPFTPEEVENFLQAQLDDMSQLEEIPSIIRCARSCSKYFPCPKPLCWYTRKHGYVVNCVVSAGRFQIKHKISNEKRKLREKICFLCQKKNCNGRASIFFD